MQQSIDVPPDTQEAAPPSTGANIIRLNASPAGAGFSRMDRSQLARWRLGPQRAVVWSDEPDAFVMLYQGTAPWASWALTPCDGVLLVWDCVSFRDIGRFGSMIEALAAIGGSSESRFEAPANVITWPHMRSGPQDANAT